MVEGDPGPREWTYQWTFALGAAGKQLSVEAPPRESTSRHDHVCRTFMASLILLQFNTRPEAVAGREAARRLPLYRLS